MIRVVRPQIWIFLLLLEWGNLNGYLRIGLNFLSDHLILQRIIVIYGIHYIISAGILWHHGVHGCAGRSFCSDNFIWEERDMLLNNRLNLLVHWHSLLFYSQIMIALWHSIDWASLSRARIELGHFNLLPINVFNSLFCRSVLSRSVHHRLHLINNWRARVIIDSWLNPSLYILETHCRRLLLLLLLSGWKGYCRFLGSEVNLSYTFGTLNRLPLWMHIERRRLWGVSLCLETRSRSHRLSLYNLGLLLGLSFINRKSRILLCPFKRCIEIEDLSGLPISELPSCMHYLVVLFQSQIRLAIVFIIIVQCLACSCTSCGKIRGTCRHQPFVCLVKRCQNNTIERATRGFAWQWSLWGCPLSWSGLLRRYLGCRTRWKISTSEVCWRSRTFLDWWLILLEITNATRWFRFIILWILSLKCHQPIGSATHLLNLFEF